MSQHITNHHRQLITHKAAQYNKIELT